MEIQRRIDAKVRAAFSPVHLEMTNESSLHRVAPGSETHLRLLIVSHAFTGKTRVQRHREVYRVLAAEKEGPVHALGLQTLTPAEWQEGGSRPASPRCPTAGGGSD